MPESCGRSFDEALLSGYVDGELTQADAQRVRLHLEDCALCRTQVDEVSQLKEMTMSSRFRVPPDDQWSEAPRGGASRLAFGLGWMILAVWVVAIAGYGLWTIWTSDQPLWPLLLPFTLWSGIVLLFVSVLIDRLKAMKTDRYRRVQK